MNSLEQFEKFYCEAHQIPLETFSKCRMGESYREPMIAKCWRFWKASREAIEVALPKRDGVNMYGTDVLEINDVRCAIETIGLKVKS